MKKMTDLVDDLPTNDALKRRNYSDNPEAHADRARKLEFLRNAISNVVDEETARCIVENIVGLARDEKSRVAVAAFESLAKLSGAFAQRGKAATSVQTVRHLVFEDRPDGDDASPEMRQPAATEEEDDES
mgnify:FL=1